MSEQNKALARRWFEEVWNKGRESAIDELFDPRGKVYGFPEPDSVLVGPEAYKVIHRQFHSAFSNVNIVIDDLIAEQDKVAIRWTCTMLHSGGGLGFYGTGKAVTFSGSSFMSSCDGKRVDCWNFMDLTILTRQLQAR